MAASLRILARGNFSAMQLGLRTVVGRTSPLFLSRGIAVTSTRLNKIPTDAEQATGLEKKEYDALAAGIEDPFNMVPLSGPPGTKDKPIEVLSMYDSRILGCICEPDATSIVWRVLKLNEVVPCDCGSYYVLRKGNPTKLNLGEPADDHHH
ncbi:cytochrome c oxidase subunit 5B, mitochondrial-like [Montipora capricornis]|uniref:cytochrome c oxidase subunit 5B, mitochondrial-like n=1 Tax=Montipora capricornis TaxID=246305 RepID=UPI0035F1684F